MLKNITLSAEKELIQKARKQASLEHTSLNIIFRKWLDRYISKTKFGDEYFQLMDELDYANSGYKFTREEMNER
ncbi:MAG: hypothetical protein V1872_11890 [bacterium]